MFLVALVVTEHVDTIEVRLVERVLLAGTALLENQPTSRPRFTRGVLVRRALVFAVAVEALPADKLASRAVEDDVTGNRKLDLFAIDPAGRRRRRRRVKSHLVPKFVCFFFGFFAFIALPARSPGALLRAASLGRHVGLDRFRGLGLRHALPTDDVKTRATVEPHHDVFVAAAIRRQAQV